MTINDYRICRAIGVSELRAYRVTGDLVKHCELHRDLQRNLVKIRAYFASVR